MNFHPELLFTRWLYELYVPVSLLWVLLLDSIFDLFGDAFFGSGSYVTIGPEIIFLYLFMIIPYFVLLRKNPVYKHQVREIEIDEWGAQVISQNGRKRYVHWHNIYGYAMTKRNLYFLDKDNNQIAIPIGENVSYHPHTVKNVMEAIPHSILKQIDYNSLKAIPCDDGSTNPGNPVNSNLYFYTARYFIMALIPFLMLALLNAFEAALEVRKYSPPTAGDRFLIYISGAYCVIVFTTLIAFISSESFRAFLSNSWRRIIARRFTPITPPPKPKSHPPRELVEPPLPPPEYDRDFPPWQ